MIRRPPACPNGCDADPSDMPGGVHHCPTCGATWRRDQLLATGRPN